MQYPLLPVHPTHTRSACSRTFVIGLLAFMLGFGWALTAELIDVTPDDRVVLTTRGRLLSNELFARLV